MKTSVTPLILLACTMVLASCDTTPPAITMLMQQVAQASQAHDSEALRACFAHEGVTADQIDQHVGGWSEYFDKDEHWTYTGITYVSLADAPNNKSILPQVIALAEPTTISGFKFAPNIKVLGFILIAFKQPNGSQAGANEYVGIASDGTAKIALIEPQK